MVDDGAGHDDDCEGDDVSKASTKSISNSTQLMRCGCDHRCFIFFQVGTIQATRLNVFGERRARSHPLEYFSRASF